MSTQKEIKQQTVVEKRKLHLRNTEQINGNTLIIGSSVTKGIKTKYLKREVNVNTTRGGTISSIKQTFQNIDLSPYNTLLLQFGENDVANKLPLQDFKNQYRSFLEQLKMEDENKRIVVGGLLPREHIDMTDYNDCLNVMK